MATAEQEKPGDATRSTWWTQAFGVFEGGTRPTSNHSLRATRRQIGNSAARALAWRSATSWPTSSGATSSPRASPAGEDTFSLTVAAGPMHAVRVFDARQKQSPIAAVAATLRAAAQAQLPYPLRRR